MGPYFTTRNESDVPTTPVVVSAPHAGLRIPECRRELMMLPEPLFFRDVDFEIHRMWEEATREAGVPFIKSEVHRYAIDLNRREDQVNARSVRGAAVAAQPELKGLIWTESTRREPIAPAGGEFVPLAPESLAELLREVWRPYYAWIEARLARARDRFGFAVLIDGHSMPSKGTAFHADPGGVRAEIVPGDFKGLACHASLSRLVMESCARHSFRAKLNDPYSGGNITQHFGKPSAGVHAIQIEVNRALYMREDSPGRPELIEAGMARLRELARELLRTAASLRP